MAGSRYMKRPKAINIMDIINNSKFLSKTQGLNILLSNKNPRKAQDIFTEALHASSTQTHKHPNKSRNPKPPNE